MLVRSCNTSWFFVLQVLSAMYFWFRGGDKSLGLYRTEDHLCVVRYSTPFLLRKWGRRDLKCCVAEYVAVDILFLR